MAKEFLCPKCRSQNVKVTLANGVVLKSLGSKLTLDNYPNNNFQADFSDAVTRCLDCEFEFKPKCLELEDLA